MVRLPDKSHGTGHTGSVYGSRDKSFAKCITLHFLSPLVLFLSFCFPFSNQKVRFTLLHTFCRQENLILPHLWQKCFPPPKRQTDRQTDTTSAFLHTQKQTLLTRNIFRYNLSWLFLFRFKCLPFLTASITDLSFATRTRHCVYRSRFLLMTDSAHLQSYFLPQNKGLSVTQQGTHIFRSFRWTQNGTKLSYFSLNY